MSLDLAARLRLGSLDLDVSLRVEAGETVALLGPNGAGKTTLLRICAGLQPLDGGSLTLEGAVLDDPAADRFLPPQQRPIAVVFQDYLLFPNLSALENVAFGLRARGVAAYFTCDAGPHPKALTTAADADAVAAALATVPGVLRTIIARAGAGARVTATGPEASL